jgi:hypothetical protein
LRVAINNKVDSGKLSPFVKQDLKASVASGELVQIKSKGASGSFRLVTTEPEKVMACTVPVQRQGWWFIRTKGEETKSS